MLVLLLTMTKSEFQIHVLPLKQKLFAFAWKLLRNNEYAGDVVQDVMLKVWEENKSLQDYRNMEAWCMTLTRNKSLDKMKRKDYRGLGLDQVQVAEQGFSFGNQADAKEALALVVDIIKSLPDKQREIIELRDFADLSYDDIAAQLNIDINQVKVYLHRARKQVQLSLHKIMCYGTSAE